MDPDLSHPPVAEVENQWAIVREGLPIAGSPCDAQGHSVLVIEHNMDFIKSSDYILDIGPEGGNGGGDLVAKGTPEEVAGTDTDKGKYLRKALRKK